MALKWILGVAGMVVGTSLVACMAAPDEDVTGGRANITEGEEFNKNNVITDSALKDKGAMSATEIQKFLEKTPYDKKKSVLADYTEGGKTAAQIMSEAATKYSINPLELLVRVQMEQGLISKTKASDESIAIAFGCGCPHAPACAENPEKYTGFANQAECAAGTLSRSMEKATTSTGTVSGWKKGMPTPAKCPEPLAAPCSQDGLKINPANAATAALYTYTPWVGEAGGGKKGVGGASLHFQVWGRFADVVGYGSSGTTTQPQQPRTNTPDAGVDAGGQVEEPGDPGDPPEETEADAGSGTTPDPTPSGDAGTGKKSDGTEGDDDDKVLGEGNAPPATNAPPPRGSSSSRSSDGEGSSSKSSEEEATEAELASKKKGQDGCSSTGGTGSIGDASLIGLAMVAVTIAGKRRRRSA